MTRRVLVPILALVASLLVAVSPSAANAAAQVAWTEVLDDVKPTELLAHANGSISAMTCTTAHTTTQAKILTSAGANAGEVKDASFSPCDNQKAVGKDGALYGVKVSSDAPSALVAYRGGTRLWEHTFKATGNCKNAELLIQAIIAGADGDIHVALHDASRSCETRSFVAGISPSGTQQYLAAVSNQEVNWLGAYKNGIVMQIGVSELAYYSHAGSKTAAVTMQLNAGEGVAAAHMANDFSGNVYAAIGHSNSPNATCREGSLTTRLAVYAPSGLQGQVARQGCTSTFSVSAGSWGGAFAGRANSGDNHWVTTLSAAGQKLAELNLPLVDDGHNFAPSTQYPRVVTDTKGNVVLLRNFTTNNGETTNVQVKLLRPSNGETVVEFDSTQFFADAGFYAQEIALVDGQIYLLGIKCLPHNCGSGEQYHLFAVALPQVGTDAPRGDILGSNPVEPTPKEEMYFLGDSYMAGEGIEPFEKEPQEESCHRSKKAWPRLAERDPSLKLRVAEEGLLACSNATSANMLEGGHGQPVQISDELRPGVRKAVISIGGNDIEFKKLIITCHLADCRNRVRRTEKLIKELDGKYGELIAAIRAKLGDDVELYFMGYPNVLPLDKCRTAPAGFGEFISFLRRAIPGGNATALAALKLWIKDADIGWRDVVRSIHANDMRLSDQEVIAVGILQGKLNNQIRKSATSRGAHFVSSAYLGSPFSGHELCPAKGKKSYFYGLNVLHPEYSFHPNEAGAKAYAEVFAHYYLKEGNS